MMRAWYDIYGLKVTDREDKPGITTSQALILEVISEQILAGFSPAQLFLAGFSQFTVNKVKAVNPTITEIKNEIPNCQLEVTQNNSSSERMDD